MLLAELVDRRVERGDHERDAEPEEELPPAGNRRAAARERARPAQVRVRHEERGRELERLEVPTRGDGGDRVVVELEGMPFHRGTNLKAAP